MTKIITAFGFLLVLSLFTVGVSSGLLQQAEAQRASDADMQCRSGQVLVYHFNMRDYKCTSESGAAQWVQHGIAENVGSPEFKAQPSSERVDKAEFAKSSVEKIRQEEVQALFDKLNSGERLTKSEERMVIKVQQFMDSQETMDYMWKRGQGIPVSSESTAMQSAHGLTASATVTSSDDPGLGHENHEIAILLPPSDKLYIGKLSFSASEPIQYISLIGPLGPGEDQGQPIWELADGTKYSLVMVDNGLKSGGWYFAGNALALHTMNPDPFTTTYSLAYSHLEPGVYPKGTVDIGTFQSMKDPGMGHEDHSIAILLPPRDIPYQGGVVAYSASENLQLVALHGPIGPGDAKGQMTWTADGEDVYALTLITEDVGNMGVWSTFSGNALAFHTMNPDGFTVSYALGGLH